MIDSSAEPNKSAYAEIYQSDNWNRYMPPCKINNSPVMIDESVHMKIYKQPKVLASRLSKISGFSLIKVHFCQFLTNKIPAI
jgi:hypothetical protein